jgi:hypothetical protein
MIDVYFIEFYVKKKYSLKLEDYYDVNKSIASNWRKNNFPDRRIKEFLYREGTIDVSELIKRIY